jgi:hypothetical protein
MTSAKPRPPLIPGETRAYPVLPWPEKRFLVTIQGGSPVR